MKITTFLDQLTRDEGKRKSVDRAQVGEIVRLINAKTNGILYSVIKLMAEPKESGSKK